MSSETPAPDRPVTVAIVNDYPVIVEGVARLLEDQPHIEVVQLTAQEAPTAQVDVILFDTFASQQPLVDLKALVDDPRYGAVLVYSWHAGREDIEHLLAHGARGYVSKTAGGAALAKSIEEANSGELTQQPEMLDEDPATVDWPGREFGLSPRESEIVCLIAQGATNEQIAKSCFLSINSVKSYIRSAYRKMGVTRRSQAVLWAVQHGMAAQASQYRRTVGAN